ncbi:MAG: hypothetical protein ACTSU5_14235 [Promethearchaeota archaeon]
MCWRCGKNPARRQMCGYCGHINILCCRDCKTRVDRCDNCGRALA